MRDYYVNIDIKKLKLINIITKIFTHKESLFSPLYWYNYDQIILIINIKSGLRFKNAPCDTVIT